jgi:hypothetical protein
MLNRRQLLALGSSSMLVPRPLLARGSSTVDRKFLFIYCYGGWDTLMVFTPKFDAEYIDTEDDATTAEANGITYVDHADRPSVASFFQNYGSRTCVINGVEVRSVTHERCQRMMFTGGSESANDDWPLLLASNGKGLYTAPHVVLSGPAFSVNYAANVVRSGEAGQIVELLDGTALDKSLLTVAGPSALGASREDAFLLARIREYSRTHSDGARRFGQLYEQAMNNATVLASMGSTVNLDPEDGGCRRDIAEDARCALNAFQAGVSRCALTKDNGWCSTSWDTHANNDLQVRNYEETFGYLNSIMADLDSREGTAGGSLADEVTICVFSEMGRHPQLSGGGRAHWTFTSVMLIGAGVRGGQVIGEMNDDFEGQPVDLATGEVTESGTALLPMHIGATLLAMGDVDYTEYLPDGAPLTAAMSDA